MSRMSRMMGIVMLFSLSAFAQADKLPGWWAATRMENGIAIQFEVNIGSDGKFEQRGQADVVFPGLPPSKVVINTTGRWTANATQIVATTEHSVLVTGYGTPAAQTSRDDTAATDTSAYRFTDAEFNHLETIECDGTCDTLRYTRKAAGFTFPDVKGATGIVNRRGNAALRPALLPNGFHFLWDKRRFDALGKSRRP